PYRAIADSREIKTQYGEAFCRQSTCNLHVNTPRSSPVHDSWIQQEHTRLILVPRRSTCDDPNQGPWLSKLNRFFFHDDTPLTQETTDRSTRAGTSRLPSGVGSQISGASNVWCSTCARVLTRCCFKAQSSSARTFCTIKTRFAGFVATLARFSSSS